MSIIIKILRELPQPAPQTMQEEFYGNVVSVIQGTAEPIVKNVAVLRILRLIEKNSSQQKRMKLLKDLKLRL